MLEVWKLVFVVALIIIDLLKEITRKGNFTDDCHFGENDWNVTLIDQAKNLEDV